MANNNTNIKKLLEQTEAIKGGTASLLMGQPAKPNIAGATTGILTGTAKNNSGSTLADVLKNNPVTNKAATPTNKTNNNSGTVTTPAAPAAPAEPAAEATATGSEKKETPAAQVTQAQYSRPASNPYAESQEVVNARNQLQAIGGYTPDATVQQALQNLQALSGQYTPGAEVQNYQQLLQQAMAAQPGAYTPSADVLAYQQMMQQALAAQPGAYAPSAEVQAAQQALQNIQNAKPQGYNSKYGDQMDSLLQQITNPGKFSYDFNGDELFKMYADEYTQRGKQASLDAMGQAAALTGGYGNSYAQQVGQQAYDQNLTQLYDRGMELRDRAYQQWLDEQNSRYNQYNLLSNADQTDYGRYRDTYGDWENERAYLDNAFNTERNYDYNLYRDLVNDWESNRDYATNLYNNERNIDYSQYRDLVGDWENNRNYLANRYDTERSLDYGQYQDARDYATNRYDTERNYDYNKYLNDRDYAANRYDTERNLDYSKYQDARDFAEQQFQYDTNMQESIRQFDESLNWDKMSNDQKYAAEYAMNILAMGQMPSDAILQAAGLSAADAEKMKAKLTSGGGGTGGSGAKTYYTDADGHIYSLNNGNYELANPENIKDTDMIDTSRASSIPNNINRELYRLLLGK